MTISERLFAELDRKNLTAYGLCQVLGINTTTTTNWKQRGTDPPAKYITSICEYLDCSVEYLLPGQDGPQGTKKEPTQEISPDELEMLELFRSLPYREQQRIIGRMQAMTEAAKDEGPKKATGAQQSGVKAV